MNNFVKNVVMNEYTIKATFASGKIECRNFIAETESVALTYAYEWYEYNFTTVEKPIEYEIVNKEDGAW